MKKIIIILVLLLSIKAMLCYGQPHQPTKFHIHHDTLKINENQTTSVLFGREIVQIDRGSAEILAQRSAVASDLLQIKSVKANFKHTNLSVLCDDGTLHVFMVYYEHQPTRMALEINTSLKPGSIDTLDINQEAFRNFALQAMQNLQPNISINTEYQKIAVHLNGIYINKDHMYFNFTLTNKSYIPFDVSRLALHMCDSRRAKRGAFQEIEVPPLYILGDTKRLNSRSKNSVVMVTSKLTLSKVKELRLQLWEDNGARHQQLIIKNKHLLKATPL